MAKKRTLQEDDTDIVSEVGARPVDPENPNGAMVADETKIKEVGAVDLESARANKEGGFNDPNVLFKYEDVIKHWPPNTITIAVNRLTGGSSPTLFINSQPRNASELYAALKELHGRREETTYEVIFRDKGGSQYRGKGRITMPSTIDEIPAPVQGHVPMNPYPYGYPPPPAPAPGYATPPQTQGTPQQPPPVVQVMPPPQPQQPDPMTMMKQAFDMVMQMQQRVPQPTQSPQPQQADPMSMMKQAFEMMTQMQQQAGAPQQAQPAAQQRQPDQMAMMQAIFEMMQTMQQQQQQQQQPAMRARAPMNQPAQQPMNPMMGMMGMPPVQTPAGMFFVPGFGYVPAERLFQALSGAPTPGAPGPSATPSYRGPAYGPRPQYDRPQYDRPQYDRPQYDPSSAYGSPQSPQQPSKTMAEQFREAVGVIRLATDIATEFGGGGGGGQPSAPDRDDSDDDNPLKVIDTGAGKIVVNKSDGSARLWETGFANLDKLLKWAGEQREAIQKEKSNQQQQQSQSDRPQLPPGYVELTPGYQPPPGFVAVPVAVPVEQIPASAQPAQPQQPFPQPPVQMPPPLSQSEPPPQQRTWGMPTIPGDGQ